MNDAERFRQHAAILRAGITSRPTLSDEGTVIGSYSDWIALRDAEALEKLAADFQQYAP